MRDSAETMPPPNRSGRAWQPAALGGAAVGGGVAALLIRPSVGATVLGAVIIAILTWYATDRRLQIQMRHEREQDSVQALRDFLDEVAASYEDARDAILSLSESRTAASGEAFWLRYDPMRARVSPVYVAYRRLQLRFPEADVIVVSFGTLRDAIHDAYEPLRNTKTLPLQPRHRQDVHRALERAHKAYNEFSSKARDYVLGLERR